MRCPGLAVKWGAICETVCKVKDPLFFPWDRCNWRHWLICDKIIIKNTISGAAGRSRSNIIFIFLMRLPGFIFTQDHAGTFAEFTDVDLFHIIGRGDDTFCKKTAKDQFCQMLRDTDQLHGQAFIYIHIHHVFHKNGFCFLMSLSVTSKKLISDIFEEI